MKTVYLVGACAAFLMPAPLLAQDFGGLRVEGRVGWDNVDIGLNIQTGLDREEIDEDGSTISYGGEIGYDLSFGSAVIGAYAGADFAQADVCGDVLGGDEACLEAERNLTAGARIGFGLTPQALLYAKGGYSNARVSASYSGIGDLFDVEDSASRSGYHLGVGAELGLGRLYGKVEYVRTQYEDFELGTSGEGSVRRNQVLAGLGIRF